VVYCDPDGRFASKTYEYAKNNPREVASMAADWIPVVDRVKAGVEAALGKDYIAGRELSTQERLMAAASIIPFGGIVKGAAKGAKIAGIVSDGAKVAGKAGDVGVAGKNIAKAGSRANVHQVGTYNQLKKISVPGDGLDVHHVGQSHVMKQLDPLYNPKHAPAIVLEADIHKSIPILKGTFSGSPRELLALDIWNLRLFTNAPNKQIKQLIEMNKQKYPKLFGRIN
jgi:hypothetical protein